MHRPPRTPRTRPAALPVLALAAVAGIAVGGLAGVARADRVEQAFTYDWSFDRPQHPFTFDPFDTMGGTRELTGVRLAFEGTMELEVGAHTYGEALRAGDWFMDASHVLIAYFNGNGEAGGLDLFEPVAIIGADDLTGDLGAGFPGEPFTHAIAMPAAGEVSVASAYFAAFSGPGPITGFMDGFFDGAVTPPANEQWIELFPTLLAQSGTVTLAYEYRLVPAPGALALAGAGGLAALRRRR